MPNQHYNRRELLRRGGALAAAASLPVAAAVPAATPAAAGKTGEVYTSIGVRPLINAAARSRSSAARRRCRK